MKITKPGLYPGMSMSEYLADPCPEPSLSSGIAHRLVSQSPAHAHAAHPRLGGAIDKATKATDTGSLIHGLALGDMGTVVVVDEDNWRTKAARERRDALLAEGKTPVLEKDAQAAKPVANALRAQLLDRGIDLSETQNELTAIAQIDGIWVKVRLDAWEPESALILDLKTTRDASAKGFSRSAISSGCAIQARLQTRVMEALHPELAGRIHHRWIALETEPPYACAVHGMAGSLRALADSQLNRAIAIWRQCLSNMSWPGYEDSDLEAPPWLLDKEEMTTNDEETTI